MIKTPQGYGMAVGFQMNRQENHVDGLDCLMEGPGRIQWNIPAYIFQFKKLLSACCVCLLFCLFFAAISNTVGKHHHRLITLKGSLKKPSFSCIAWFSWVQTLKLILYPFHDIGQAFVHHAFIIHNNIAQAGC